MIWKEIWTINGSILEDYDYDHDKKEMDRDVQNKNRAMDTYYASNLVFGDYVFIFFGNISKNVRFIKISSAPQANYFRNSVLL